MKSRGGKIQYRCSQCESVLIERLRLHGQDSFMCEACGYFAPWRERTKRRIKEDSQ